jgi:hypothetical protein
MVALFVAVPEEQANSITLIEPTPIVITSKLKTAVTNEARSLLIVRNMLFQAPGFRTELLN